MDLSTAPAPNDLGRLRRSHRLRTVFFVVLSAFLLAGALGAYGVRHREASATGGGYELTVRYPTVTRPGLASVWSVEVRSTDGSPLAGTIALATTADYFAIYDENGLDPDPVSAMTDGEDIVWEFEPSDGATTLSVEFDARIEPAVQLSKRPGRTSVLDDDGAPVATVDYRTWVLP
ncbi:MAG: hypothetical protein Q8K58_11930 [Acidimicrobiales bacterium]|nr:hypothetical protein [Acidimicrobiales bacterium]